MTREKGGVPATIQELYWLSLRRNNAAILLAERCGTAEELSYIY